MCSVGRGVTRVTCPIATHLPLVHGPLQLRGRNWIRDISPVLTSASSSLRHTIFTVSCSSGPRGPSGRTRHFVRRTSPPCPWDPALKERSTWSVGVRRRTGPRCTWVPVRLNSGPSATVLWRRVSQGRPTTPSLPKSRIRPGRSSLGSHLS